MCEFSFQKDHLNPTYGNISHKRSTFLACSKTARLKKRVNLWNAHKLDLSDLFELKTQKKTRLRRREMKRGIEEEEKTEKGETCQCIKKSKASRVFQVRRVCPGALIPTRGTKGSAGWDLYACLDRIKSRSHSSEDLEDEKFNIVIPPQQRAMVRTGCTFAMESGYYGRIAPRSSWAWLRHCDVGGGVIDSDYRGEVTVILFNLSTISAITIKDGDRIAQIIFTRCATEELKEVVEFDEELKETERGKGAFGSTGK